MVAVLERLPVAIPGRAGRWGWPAVVILFAIGLVLWGTGNGLAGLWFFVVGAVGLALILPFTYAVVSPLFAGLFGWLVDMLPFVILAGWAAVVLRYLWMLRREKRPPRPGRWIWLPIILVLWTALGVVAIEGSDLKHFVLLLGIQGLVSGIVIAIVDTARRHEQRVDIAVGLVLFVIVLSVGVLFDWVGVPLQELQDRTVSKRAEAAYGVDAFPNNIGMIKYTWAKQSGAAELGVRLKKAREENPEIPDYDVFRPKFGAYDGMLVVRFYGSAEDVTDDLRSYHIKLIYDNVGVAPAETVPRLRSFPRNALTYAGVCAVAFPIAFFLAWTGTGRRKLLGRIGIAATLFGAGLSLVRGSWVAIVLGIIYLAIDGLVTRRRKIDVIAWFVVGALVLTVLFYAKYAVDPLTARAGAEGSIGTREDVYAETIESVGSIYILVGYGTETPRTESGLSHQLGTYIPKAGTHSTYLNYLFRTGVPGVLFIIALYVLAGLHARAAARTTRGDERSFNSLLTAAVVIAAAHAVVLSLFVEPIYTLSISILLGLAIATGIGLPRSVWPWRRGATA